MKHRKPRWFTYKQKELILETLAAASSLYDTYAFHDDWDVGEDSDFIKLHLRQYRSYIRAYNVFFAKTAHIKKHRRRRRRSKPSVGGSHCIR